MDDGRAGRACRPAPDPEVPRRGILGCGRVAGRGAGDVVRELRDPKATLVLDDTQVIKKGDKSVGVAHQHCGVTGACTCRGHGHATVKGARRPGCPTPTPSPPSRSWASPC
ncbi:hypothetical protein EJ357_30145 [Streptomyces cyaneochromogenes]|uniref:Transposase IS701-like DDE domain-containing protein n=1 Tax=Streptomyces cyaneochromogenes TaxID=2496836 RepID=A0A3Q9F1P0_9ACTN|nr:hypothetical protein EJ357_30145 [Streptomyces cyaneochromogenes]